MRVLAYLAAAAAVVTAAGPSFAAESTPRPRPRLVVAISIDQFSANLYSQYRGRLTGGLKTLSEHGLVYAQAYQSHAMTETCPGHSTLLTGKHPAGTGITGNEWRDGTTGKDVYCVSDPSVTLAHDAKARPVGPAQLRTSTLGDWLKLASPQSRVVAVSGKDRAAITMGGHKADGVFWYEPGFGFTTYVRAGEDARSRLEPVDAINVAAADDLRKLPPVWTYADHGCKALEATWVIGGETWRSRLPLAPPALPSNPGRALAASPRYDEIVLSAARGLIDRYEMGRDDSVDLLAVSLSATDYVGHRFGTQGPEMCDQMHRLDKQLGAFLKHLRKIDPNVLVVLAADHGGSDFPERSGTRGYPDAGRTGAQWIAAVNADLRRDLGLDYDPLAGAGGDPAQLYLVGTDGRAMAGADRAGVLAAALKRVKADPKITDAFLLTDLLAAPWRRDVPPEELSVRDRMAMSAVAGRSGDIMVALRPQVTHYGDKVGDYISGHGTPWDYDRRIPMIFWRPGATGQERFFPTDSTDIAPTLAAVIGVTAPADLDGRCLDLGGTCPNASPPP